MDFKMLASYVASGSWEFESSPSGRLGAGLQPPPEGQIPIHFVALCALHGRFFNSAAPVSGKAKQTEVAFHVTELCKGYNNSSFSFTKVEFASLIAPCTTLVCSYPTQS